MKSKTGLQRSYLHGSVNQNLIDTQITWNVHKINLHFSFNWDLNLIDIHATESKYSNLRCMCAIIKCFDYHSMHHILHTISNYTFLRRDRRGRDRMVVGFTTTYAISAYHHWCSEFESRSEWGVRHHVIKFVSDLRQVGGFLLVLQFPTPIKLIATI